MTLSTTPIIHKQKNDLFCKNNTENADITLMDIVGKIKNVNNKRGVQRKKNAQRQHAAHPPSKKHKKNMNILKENQNISNGSNISNIDTIESDDDIVDDTENDDEYRNGMNIINKNDQIRKHFYDEYLVSFSQVQQNENDISSYTDTQDENIDDDEDDDVTINDINCNDRNVYIYGNKSDMEQAIENRSIEAAKT